LEAGGSGDDEVNAVRYFAGDYEEGRTVWLERGGLEARLAQLPGLDPPPAVPHVHVDSTWSVERVLKDQSVDSTRQTQYSNLGGALSRASTAELLGCGSKVSGQAGSLEYQLRDLHASMGRPSFMVRPSRNFDFISRREAGG